MVMEKKTNQRSKLALLTLCLTFASGTYVYADGFYTIIGPDGRPMIVPKRIENRPLASDNRVTETVKREISVKQQSQEKQQINNPSSAKSHAIRMIRLYQVPGTWYGTGTRWCQIPASCGNCA